MKICIIGKIFEYKFLDIERKINVFNVPRLNETIFFFKQYELSSLEYVGGSKQNKNVFAGRGPCIQS